MNFTEAVKLAKEGKETGYRYLYDETYQSKYYLALQYMKNEDAAQDVVQDAYIKAFSKLDTLDYPEAFSSWMGRIVANTAKNELVKKNPLLFTDLDGENQEGDFTDLIVDDHISNQPELSYTRNETREMVRELIDSLSDEQRICILMFHIEGESIRDIAAALECSENTVKSRLNYGRKNLKVKAEELQKKGYKLFGIGPVVLLVMLMQKGRNNNGCGRCICCRQRRFRDKNFSICKLQNFRFRYRCGVCRHSKNDWIFINCSGKDTADCWNRNISGRSNRSSFHNVL